MKRFYQYQYFKSKTSVKHEGIFNGQYKSLALLDKLTFQITYKRKNHANPIEENSAVYLAGQKSMSTLDFSRHIITALYETMKPVKRKLDVCLATAPLLQCAIATELLQYTRPM